MWEGTRWGVAPGEAVRRAGVRVAQTKEAEPHIKGLLSQSGVAPRSRDAPGRPAPSGTGGSLAPSVSFGAEAGEVTFTETSWSPSPEGWHHHPDLQVAPEDRRLVV